MKQQIKPMKYFILSSQSLTLYRELMKLIYRIPDQATRI